MPNRLLRIKAWDDLEKKWLTGFYVDAEGEVWLTEDPTITSPIPHGNWIKIISATGMFDKKGEDIWENDIVRYDGEPKKMAVVRFVADWNGYGVDFGDHQEPLLMEKFEDKLVVVGNIYEHEHLLAGFKSKAQTKA